MTISETAAQPGMLGAPCPTREVKYFPRRMKYPTGTVFNCDIYVCLKKCNCIWVLEDQDNKNIQQKTNNSGPGQQKHTKKDEQEKKRKVKERRAQSTEATRLLLCSGMVQFHTPCTKQPAIHP